MLLQHSVPEFEASKYLVTNEEFLAFVNDGGYNRRELWTEEGTCSTMSKKIYMYCMIANSLAFIVLYCISALHLTVCIRLCGKLVMVDSIMISHLGEISFHEYSFQRNAILKILFSIILLLWEHLLNNWSITCK